MGRLRVTVVSDYICPWCYLGLARVDHLQREFDIHVQWQPYELHPEIPPEGKPLGDRARAYYEGFRDLASASGLPFEPPQRAPNSHRALEAAEFAREHGAFDAYHRALFTAYFADGRDIGDLNVLAESASACGLDPAALRGEVDSKRYASLVDERAAAARQDGVTSTPTFIFENGDRRLPIVGAQEYQLFQSVARRLAASSAGARS